MEGEKGSGRSITWIEYSKDDAFAPTDWYFGLVVFVRRIFVSDFLSSSTSSTFPPSKDIWKRRGEIYHRVGSQRESLPKEWGGKKYRLVFSVFFFNVGGLPPSGWECATPVFPPFLFLNLITDCRWKEMLFVPFKLGRGHLSGWSLDCDFDEDVLYFFLIRRRPDAGGGRPLKHQTRASSRFDVGWMFLTLCRRHGPSVMSATGRKRRSRLNLGVSIVPHF